MSSSPASSEWVPSTDSPPHSRWSDLLCLSPPILSEYLGVLRRGGFPTPCSSHSSTCSTIRRGYSSWNPALASPPFTQTPRQHVPRMRDSGTCGFILSGDRHLRRITAFRGIPILSHESTSNWRNHQTPGEPKDSPLRPQRASVFQKPGRFDCSERSRSTLALSLSSPEISELLRAPTVKPLVPACFAVQLRYSGSARIFLTQRRRVRREH